MARLRVYDTEGVNRKLELSGKRAINWFRYQRIASEATYTQFEDKPSFDEVEPLAERYMKMFIAREVDRVDVAYMRFYNAARQAPVIRDAAAALVVRPRHAGVRQRRSSRPSRSSTNSCRRLATSLKNCCRCRSRCGSSSASSTRQ